MANKLSLATAGIAVAVVVYFLSDGNFILGGMILIVSVWLVGSALSQLSPETAVHLLTPMERLITPFQYLATLDTSDADLVGAYIYEELDLDARSELSEHVVSGLVNSQDLPRCLAKQIAIFRANVISKIDERVDADKIGDDPEWRVLLDEFREIYKKLSTIAG